MDVIERCIAEARRRHRTVVLPEGEDGRIVRAAARLRDEGLAEVILLGDGAEVAAVAAGTGVSLDGIRIVHPPSNPRLGEYAEAFAADRRNVSVAAAERRLRKPLIHAGMMVRCGDAQAMVAGAANPTGRVITAGLLTIGAAPGIETPSSFFVMVVPSLERPLLYADCAVTVAPDARELADIALASVESARSLLGKEPRVALLSGEDRSAAADTVREAGEFVRARAPALALDVGVSLRTAVDGGADVLVFPHLNAGNIGYKAAQVFAGASAIGPFLQGFARPVSDLSRGASVDDIVKTCAVLLAGA